MNTSARQMADDLLEALKALKACRDVLINFAHPAYEKTREFSTSIHEASRVLDKYPNLK